MIPKQLHGGLRSTGRFCLLLLSMITMLSMLNGCLKGIKPEPKPTVDQTGAARALVSEGRLFEAADEYLRLSRENEPPQADIFMLEAAVVLIDAGDLTRAKSLADAMKPDQRYPEVGFRKALVNGSLALAQNRPDEVLAILPSEQVPGIAPSVLAQARYLRARAYEQLQEPLPAARSRILADPYPSDDVQRQENHQLIWRDLLAVPPAQLAEARRSLDPASGLAGWIDLTELWRSKLIDTASLTAATQVWTQQHPLHPANGRFVSNLIAQSVRLARAPRKVALLLPFDGPFEQAAIAIRDGFAAAWFADADNSERPQIMLFDTASGSIGSVYERAAEAQADFIVGPVRKDALAELLGSSHLSVPTLLLNRSPTVSSTLGSAGNGTSPQVQSRPSSTDTGTGSSAATTTPLAPVHGGEKPLPATLEPGLDAPVYEYALNPEDEAARVAERAWFDGHGRAAIIAPQGAWGERVAQAFATTWERLGGMVVVTELYAADAGDMSPAVRGLLNIDQSRERAKQIRALLNRRIKHVPRRRDDIDMIFMAAFPTQARQLRPTLKFHHASDVPVYATSHLYGGSPEPSANLDLDGVIFGDMPWILNAGSPGISRTQIENLWPERTAGLARLYAFGADAYALINRAGRLRAQTGNKFSGLSGQLGMDRENRVTRQLTWATFKAGLAQPLGPNIPSQ